MVGKESLVPEMKKEAPVITKPSPLATFIKDKGLGDIVKGDTLNKVQNDLKGKKIDKNNFLVSLGKFNRDLEIRVRARLEQQKETVQKESGHGRTSESYYERVKRQ